MAFQIESRSIVLKWVYTDLKQKIKAFLGGCGRRLRKGKVKVVRNKIETSLSGVFFIAFVEIVKK